MKETKVVLKHVLLLLLAAIWLVPILWLVVTSFSAYKGINISHFFPEAWSLDNFKQVLVEPDSVVQYMVRRFKSGASKTYIRWHY